MTVVGASLEELLEAAFERTSVKPRYRGTIRDYLTIVRHRDAATYHHCIRIGLYSEAIATHLGYDARAALMAGTLHDLGKALVPGDVLRKTADFGEADRQAILPHPEHTYALLRGIMEFSGQIGLRHHRFQQPPYPQTVPASLQFSERTLAWFDTYAEIVSIADFYDAATTRTNSAGTASNNPEGIKEFFHRARPLQAVMASELIDAGILHPNKIGYASTP